MKLLLALRAPIRTELSRDDVADHVAVFHFQSLAAGDFEPARVEAELMEHGGVDVGDVMAVLDGWKPSSSVAP